MNENFTITQQLIQYLDNELNEPERLELERKIVSEPGIKEELDHLRIAKHAVNNYGLQQKIALVHLDMMKEIKATTTATKKPAIVRSIIMYALRVAAAILILIVASAVYQYSTLSPEKLFGETYTPYQLSQTRSAEDAGAIEEAYKQNNFTQVITLFEKNANPDIPDYFLAGEAYLHKADAAKAIRVFITIQQKNSQQQLHLFEEESSYYLALSYLLNHEPQKALPLFEEIYHNKNHAYHDKVSRWQLLKLKWLIYKS